MLRAILEGTPASFPVKAYDPSSNPTVWEAGAVAMLDSTAGDGTVTLSDGGATHAHVGIFADRRNTFTNISTQTFLPSKPGQYGDEALFNQPGYGNSLYGQTGGVNNVIPANTVPTTTMLKDETGMNPNTDSRFVTVYIRGGVYETDQVVNTGTTYAAGQPLYIDSTGLLTNAVKNVVAGYAMGAVDGNGQLRFKLTIV